MNQLENSDIQEALKLLETNFTKLAEAIARRGDEELMTIFGVFINSHLGVFKQLTSKIEAKKVIRKAMEKS